MGKYDGATVEILNWEKFNPRKDLKATAWFRLQNSLFEDPNFFDWSHSEILFWVYILSLASKKQTGSIRFSDAHAERIGRFKLRDAESSLEKLVELQCIKVTLRGRDIDVTRTLHARHTTNERTDVTNETNVTNAATSDSRSASPMIAHPMLFGEASQDLLEKTKREAQDAWVKTYGDTAWIKQELGKAWAWCKCNPDRNPKSNWSRFVNNWLSRAWEQHRKTLPTNQPTPQRRGIAAIIADHEAKKNAG